MAHGRFVDMRLALILGLFFFGFSLIFSAPILADPDTYWHIGVGRWIVEHRAIPSVDQFSNSITGTKWVPHEWLTEVIFAEVYRWFGWAGLIFLTALLAGASLSVFAYFALEGLLQDGWRHGVQWLLFSALIFASALITPNGIDGVLVLTNYDIPFMMSAIKEWQSPDFQHLQPLEIWLLGFLFLSVSC